MASGSVYLGSVIYPLKMPFITSDKSMRMTDSGNEKALRRTGTPTREELCHLAFRNLFQLKSSPTNYSLLCQPGVTATSGICSHSWKWSYYSWC